MRWGRSVKSTCSANRRRDVKRVDVIAKLENNNNVKVSWDNGLSAGESDVFKFNL